MRREGIKIHLGLSHNWISDITALVDNLGLGEGDGIDLRMNWLSGEAYSDHIPALRKRGVKVLSDPPPADVGKVKSPYEKFLTLTSFLGS